MPELVRAIMNPTVLYVRDGDRMTLVLSQILAYGVTGVPVLDEEHRPVGFVSLRDIASSGDERTRVTSPVFCVGAEDRVDSAARALAEAGYRHAVVVDSAGVAVGMVSAIDFLRALVGLPGRHPPRFGSGPVEAQRAP